MVSSLHSQTYQDRLLELGMMTLKERRIRGDMLQTWKILHGHDNVKDGTWFIRLSSTAVRETRASLSPLYPGAEQGQHSTRTYKGWYIIQ